MNPRPSLLSIFAVFLRIGVTAYGGPAMMPLMRGWLVDRKAWLTPESFKFGLSICQSIPGGSLMQLSAYTGLLLRGLPGALAGYIGFALPATALITALAAIYHHYQGLKIAQSAMSGLSAVVLAIIFLAVFDFWQRFAQGYRRITLTLIAAGLFLAGIGPAYILMAAGVAGLFLFKAEKPAELDLPAHKPPVAGLAGLAALAAGWLVYAFFNDRTMFDLSLSMAKVDVLAFGGYGAFAVMYHEVVEVYGWMSAETFIDGMALAQVTPGPVLLGSAFMGYHLRGIAGAICGAVWIFTPSFFILMAVVPSSARMLGAPAFRRFISGVFSTLGGMLLAVGLTLAYATPWTASKAAIAVAALLILRRGVDPLWVVAAGAGLGALIL